LNELTQIKLHLILDLIAHREISNGIASRFGVMHQSPQLLIKEGNQFMMFPTAISLLTL
jgi:bacillithiol system protein YtxJ